MRAQLAQIGVDVMAILIPVLASLAAEYLRRKLGTERIRKLKEELQAKQELAALAVRFVQQAYGYLGGPERAERAMAWMAVQVEARGLAITAEELQGLIEAALRAIKDEFGEAWAKTSAKAS